jgi:hypothetical protein
MATAQFLADLEQMVSPARLRRYRPAGTSDLDAVANYLWNVSLAESLYCSINAVEIALRNTMHDALTQRFGTANWYDRHGLLEPEQRKQVANVKQRIQTRGDTVTPDRVVSELTLGFWVTILSRNYATRLWQGYPPSALRMAFPRVPKRQRQRATIQQHYNAIRELRNRVFHHEPLFDDHLLTQRHAAIYQGIGWISPKMREPLRLVDRFPDVYANGRARIDALLQQHLRLG